MLNASTLLSVAKDPVAKYRNITRRCCAKMETSCCARCESTAAARASPDLATAAWYRPIVTPTAAAITATITTAATETPRADQTRCCRAITHTYAQVSQSLSPRCTQEYPR